jgi:hypothetical protein
MRIRLLLAATAAVTLAACSDSSTAPHQLSPDRAAKDIGITCRSGYHIATREDGTQYCEPDNGSGAEAVAQPTSTTSSSTN